MTAPKVSVKVGPLAVAAAIGGGVLLYLWHINFRNFRESRYKDAGLLGLLGHTANVASAGTLEKAGEAIGGKVYEWLNPTPDAYVTYLVTFPNGKTGAVNSESIAKDGTFEYRGQTAGYAVGTRFRIAVVDGSHYAQGPL